MTEKQVVIKSNNRKLYGFMHMPDKEEKVPGIIFFHGFTGTSVEPHRVFVKLARALADKGYGCLRFDFSGAGNSEGDSEETAFTDWVADAQNACSFLSSYPGIDKSRMSFCGISMGCAVLLYLLKKKLVKAERAVFLSPASAMPQLSEKIMSEYPRKGGFIDFHGNKISVESMKTASEIELLDVEYENLPKALITHCENDTLVPCAAGEALYKTYKKNNGNARFKTWATGGHTYNDFEIEAELIAETVNFFLE